MRTVFMLCGIPGSGKTTLARELAEQHHAKLHSYDDIPNSRRNLDRDGKIKKQWIDAMNADLLDGYSVVCDSTNLTIHSRKEIIEQLAPCRKILMVKAVPLEVCIQRNKDRECEVPENQIVLAARLLEPPADDEGWNRVYVYRD